MLRSIARGLPSFFACGALFATLATSSNAHAQYVDDQGREMPPPPPRRERRVYYEAGPPPYGAFRHDGLYVRGGLGVGGISASPDIDGTSNDGISVDGGGIAAEVMVGGTLEPGVVIGGAFFFQQAFNPSYTDSNGNTYYNSNGNKSLNFLFLGPFIDWYPSSRRGFHVGAFGGLARLNETSPGGGDNSYSPWGGALGLMIGHDFWIAPDFSFGLSLHVAGGSVSGAPGGNIAGVNNPNVGTTFGVGQLFLSILYN